MTTLIERIIENETEIYVFMLIMNPLKTNFILIKYVPRAFCSCTYIYIVDLLLYLYRVYIRVFVARIQRGISV